MEKLERWHQSVKSVCIRPLTPLTLEDARRLLQRYVDYYNAVRLHSAIGYVTPQDMLAGRQAEIHSARDHKLEQVRQLRQPRRQQASAAAGYNGVTMPLPGETEAALRGRNHAEGKLGRLIVPMFDSAEAPKLDGHAKEAQIGDAPCQPSWRSFLISDPGTKFPVETGRNTQKQIRHTFRAFCLCHKHSALEK